MRTLANSVLLIIFTVRSETPSEGSESAGDEVVGKRSSSAVKRNKSLRSLRRKKGDSANGDDETSLLDKIRLTVGSNNDPEKQRKKSMRRKQKEDVSCLPIASHESWSSASLYDISYLIGISNIFHVCWVSVFSIDFANYIQRFLIGEGSEGQAEVCEEEGKVSYEATELPWQRRRWWHDTTGLCPDRGSASA